MKIAIGCDHGAFEYKETIRKMLEAEGYEVTNCGCYGPDSVDYPDIAVETAKKVAAKTVDAGILMCGTGIGISIAANKVHGIRCALCTDTTMARLTREHNDANMLAMGARIIGIELAKDIVHTFLATSFSNDDRHVKRIEKLMAEEN